MRIRGLLAALAILPFVVCGLHGQDNIQFFPVDQIRPGLKGVGKTVFEGDKIEEFQVEFLGVLKNATAPRHDVILGRLSGGPLEKTGVAAGMSGSPVYIDGKLVGAVALSFPFSKEALAGITPIEEMTDVVPLAPQAPRPSQATNLRIVPIPGSREAGRLIPDEENALESWTHLLGGSNSGSSISALRLPLRFGGFSDEIIEKYASMFRQLGLEPMHGGVMTGGPDTTAESIEIAPGSMISLLLARGDLNLSVDCTVTYRKGNDLYACGHRFLLTGPARIPFAASRVLATVANLASSFKVDVAGPLAGSITQDRFGAIYGVLGEKSPQIPVHIRVDSSLNRVEEYNFDLVQESFLSPLLLNLAVASTLGATERMVGPSTLEINGAIRLANSDPVRIDDVISGNTNTPAGAAVSAATPLGMLLSNNFPNVQIEGIDLSIVSRTENRTAKLEQAWSSKSEVSPGDKIEVTAVLRAPGGETLTQKLPVVIPESVSDKTLSLVVGSGSTINMLETRISLLTSAPRDLQQLVQALNKMRRNNRLYALLMAPQRSFMFQGDEFPSPPPSLLQTFLADPAVASSVTLSGTSIVGDFETKAIPYAIQGQKYLLLKVLGKKD
ncbi:MAG: hypothetical protein LAN62_06235 [Acidobacteriia bacterium]|nr:hypothetical protein [Terriglobia bacterium]